MSRIFARGNFAKPPTILDTTVIVAVRECDPKELVTNGVRALTTTSCREKMTYTSQILGEIVNMRQT